jgi:methylmalonyl-CoA/ethylmalonyl-CoA epimerase
LSNGISQIPFRLDHFGIVVRSIDTSLPWYLGGAVATRYHVEALEVEICLIHFPLMCVELIEPFGEASPLHSFMVAGGGLHHLAYVAEDLSAAVSWMEKQHGARRVRTLQAGAGSSVAAAFLVMPDRALGVDVVEFVKTSTYRRDESRQVPGNGGREG